MPRRIVCVLSFFFDFTVISSGEIPSTKLRILYQTLLFGIFTRHRSQRRPLRRLCCWIRRWQVSTKTENALYYKAFLWFHHILAFSPSAESTKCRAVVISSCGTWRYTAPLRYAVPHCYRGGNSGQCTAHYRHRPAHYRHRKCLEIGRAVR